MNDWGQVDVEGGGVQINRETDFLTHPQTDTSSAAFGNNNHLLTVTMAFGSCS